MFSAAGLDRLRPPAGRWPLLLALSELLLCRVSPRPLPDKNELANACYFTYRVGYIICDQGLGPEDAEREMKAGHCNQDFRLMASDFQRRVVHHYGSGGPPPLEEATWLLTSPDNFQHRTLMECPAMQVMALLLLAESKLYLFGPGRTSPAGELLIAALRQAGEVPADVYSALARAWPMELAMQRFQDTMGSLRLMVEEHRSAPAPFEAHVVFCGCAESLEWFSDLAKLTAVAGDLVVFSYNTCQGSAGGSAASSAPLDASAFRAVRELPVPAHAGGARGECSARGVLAHILGSAVGTTPAFTLALSAAQPEGSELQLLEMVLRSIAQRTLDVSFLSLGMQRRALYAPSACDIAVWRQTLGVGLPCGYEGARFLVSGARVQERTRGYFERLLGLLDAPPAACRGDAGAGGPVDIGEKFSSAWHVAFGKEAWLPLRAEDEELPVFLRFADGPSGFQRTRMPKTSSYLATVDASPLAKVL